MKMKVNIKKAVKKAFPDSIATKLVDQQKHPIWNAIGIIVVLIVIVSGVSVLNGSGKYSHPFHKHHIMNQSRMTVSNSQAKALHDYTAQENTMLNRKYYKLAYNRPANIVTIQLGSKAQSLIDKASDGNQSDQEETTNAFFGQIEQSKQLSQTAHDKELGFVMASPDGTMDSFVQNGHVKYAVLPVLSTVK